MKRFGKCRLWFALLIALCARQANADEILTFDDIGGSHGTVVTNQYSGVAISAFNHGGGGVNTAMLFNSQFTGSTTDPDLLGPPEHNNWNGGNFADLSTPLGNLLIIQEHSGAPDDEGSRPAGYLQFDFDDPITSFGFDLVDVEKKEIEKGSVEFFNGDFLEIVQFGTLGIIPGDRSANRIAPINVSAYGFPVTGVRINLGGSGAVDNILYTSADDPVPPITGIPEPATIWMWGLLVAAFVVVVCQRKRAIA